MPIHDWTRVPAGTFHHFHQRWIGALCDGFNTGGLPPGYFALAEQVAGGPIPDVLTLQHAQHDAISTGTEVTGGVAVETAPPQTRFILRADQDVYARMADRVTIRHEHGDVVAVVEVVSPGNKDSRHALRAFVDKCVAMLAQGIHQLIIDLIPPTKRDPQGIHKAIWDEIHDQAFALPSGKPLTLASYMSGPEKIAYVEPIAVGDTLPDMPLFLTPDMYVRAPLEASYQTTWNVFPMPLKSLLEQPARRRRNGRQTGKRKN